MAARLLFRKLPLVEVAVRLTSAREIPVVVPFAVDLRDRLGESGSPCQLLTSFLAEPAPGAPPEFVFGPGHDLNAFALGFTETGVVAHVFRRHVAVFWSGAADFPVDTTRTPREAEDYPGYLTTMRPTMEAVGKAVADLLGVLPISVAQIAYTSDFALQGDATVFDYLRIAEPDTLAFGGSVLNLEVASRREDGTDLRAACRQHEGRAWVQTSAGRFVTDPALEAGLRALDGVHNVLGLGFSEILTNKARREWELVER